MVVEDRLQPIPDEHWPGSIAGMKDGFAGSLNVYRTMAHHPRLLRAWASLREHLVNRTALGRQFAEVTILRSGFRLGSDYEWAQHVVRARSYGLADSRIAALRGAPEGMAPDDAVIAQAVDDLFERSRLSAGSRAALVRLVGVEGMLDLLATVGFYSTLGYILNSFATPLDDDIASELAAKPMAE